MKNKRCPEYVPMNQGEYSCENCTHWNEDYSFCMNCVLQNDMTIKDRLFFTILFIAIVILCMIVYLR